MAIPEAERARGVGKTSSVYRRRGNGVDLDISGIGATVPPSITEITRVPKAVRQELYSETQKQFGELGPHIVESVYKFERGALAREPLPVEVQRVSNPTPEDLVRAARNSGVTPKDGIIFELRARR